MYFKYNSKRILWICLSSLNKIPYELNFYKNSTDIDLLLILGNLLRNLLQNKYLQVCFLPNYS